MKLSNYQIEDLPYFKENDPNVNPYQDFYSEVDLLRLVHKMSHIILKKPTKLFPDEYIPSDWHICHQFAFFYNHGCLINDRDFTKRIPYEAFEEYADISNKDIENDVDVIWDQIEKNQSEICRRYLKPEQDKQLLPYRERFLTPQIIASLSAFNINIDQFWYMFLFLIDYIYQKTHHVTDYYPTALESFDELYAITSEIPKDNPRDCSIIDTCLELKYDKRKLKIENPNTIKLLGEIVQKYCEQHRNEHDEDHNWCSDEWLVLTHLRAKKRRTMRQMFGIDEFDGWKYIKSKTSLFLFRKYLKEFFKDVKGIRNKSVDFFLEDAGTEAKFATSINVELLITRLAWAAHYLGKDYYPDDKDYLKSLLKKFKPDEQLSSSGYFWSIGVY